MRATARRAGWCTTSPILTGTPASSATFTRTCRRRRGSASPWLQTPEFVEEWILLTHASTRPCASSASPQVRMIDPDSRFRPLPAGRLRAAARRMARSYSEPELPPAAQAQKALDAVAGVDLNPFAVEIARFRLLLAAAPGAPPVKRASPPRRTSTCRSPPAIACCMAGTSRQARTGGAEEGFRRTLRHHYAAEDLAPFGCHSWPAALRRRRQSAVHHAEGCSDAGCVSRDLRELVRR